VIQVTEAVFVGQITGLAVKASTAAFIPDAQDWRDKFPFAS